MEVTAYRHCKAPPPCNVNTLTKIFFTVWPMLQ